MIDMWRNREIFLYTAMAAVITAVAVILCWNVNRWAGLICLAGCGGIYAVCIFFTRRRYRKIAELSEYLQRLANGGAALGLRDNAEGELSILKNEIYKVTVTLTEQAGTLHKDKQKLADALSDISHQLKTPLTSLGIMVDLLEDNNLPPEKRHEFIASMRGGLTRMEWLVLTLLKMAKLDVGSAMLKTRRVKLSHLIEKALAALVIPMEIKKQTLNIYGEDAEIRCDPDWTAEALGNVMKNAVEHTPEGGHVEIVHGINPLYAYISVRDSGAGIDKNDLPHLFHRFYRGQNASRDGVGIGLAMSLSILQKQNGDIEVANDSGGVFTLKFYHAQVSD